jgi:glutathionyl-hydroquinone reductase
MSVYLHHGRREGWYDAEATAGEFVSTQSVFRNWMTTDGLGHYPAEPSRYQLYVSLSCPWTHRTLIVRVLKKLETGTPVSIVEPVMSVQSWTFSSALSDHTNGYSYLHQFYTAAHADYSVRMTVPGLWDKATHRRGEPVLPFRMFGGLSPRPHSMMILIRFASNPANPRKILWWLCCYAWWPDEF